jgi:hypothetical protein
MQVPILLLVKLAVSVFAGFWLVSRMSGLLRALVVRAMPMKYRISETSFVHQTRFTTLVSVILGTLLAGAIYGGLNRLQAQISGPPEKRPVKKEEKTEIYQLPLPVDAPEIVDTVARQGVGKEEQVQQAFVVKPAPKAREPKAPAVITPETWFVQLHAFEEAELAWTAQVREEKRLRRPVWVADGGEAWSPYKVLAGPFADRASAEAWRRQKRLRGYPRQLGELRLYAR